MRRTRPNCSIDACMCSVDGHGYNIGATRVSVCITRHYICHPLQGHWGKSVQIKIADVIQQSLCSLFFGKYHRQSALKATIIIGCSVWDELRMFRPIRWIKNTAADPRKGSYAREKGVTIYKQCSGR